MAGTKRCRCSSQFSARTATLLVLLRIFVLALGTPRLNAAPAQQPGPTQTRLGLHVTVMDENGAAVSSARVTLAPVQGTPLHSETDYAGRAEFSDLRPGDYSLEVEKEGYFAITEPGIRVGEVDSADVTLNHTREFSEQVNVVESPPAIDPGKTQASETLSSENIIDLPFPVSRDFRYALPMLPGVLQDYTGQLHVDGASTRQIYDQMDGFNLSDPASGQFLTRVSVDALRSVDVASSRYSTEFGKGSGGVLSLRTGMGDDHWRFTGTDFFPGVSDRRGLAVNNWTPRGLISGPIRTGKAWFMEALEGEYDLTVFKELPVGADRYSVYRASNLSKAQVNLAQNNNLTVSFLVNYLISPHSGLDPLDPLPTTQRYSTDAFVFSAKDQHLFENGLLLEAGVATSTFYTNVVPMGDQTYVITPNGTSGNYYLTNHNQTGRTQGIANLFVPPLSTAGQHQIKLGIDLDRLDDHQEYNRQPYVVDRANGTVSRRVSFTGAPPYTRYDDEAGAYAQDRWSITPRWLLEPGVRVDWDEIVHGLAASPRLASTVLLRRNGDSKFSWGVGVYRDPSNLDILTRALTGTRTDYFYDATGVNLLQPPVLSAFSVNPDRLRFSFVTNASVAFEQKLPGRTYLHVELLDRRARNIWTFVNPGASTLPEGPFTGDFLLTNDRRDHYDSATLTLRHVFKQNHVVFAAYTRSRALTNADFGYGLDSVLFSPQAGGPLAWDTPNRFLSWGWVPFVHKIDAGYTLDWRTGFPFSVQNDSQQVVGAPDSRRFPPYFSVDLSLERRFKTFGFQWALRAGVDNVFARGNYSYVNSNIDSPNFLTFTGAQGRSFIARIRLLGRK